MAASVLTFSDQKKTLSAKKGKKKTVKNVLGLPSSFRLKSFSVDEDERQRLCSILERVLPTARIPCEEINKQENDNLKGEKKDLEISESVKEARINRSKLALGVNDLNRSIKKNSISAALLASDVQPRFLVHHINLLCQHNKVPYIHFPDLRRITEKCLGFQCIALGFRKDCDNFKEAVSEIVSIHDNKIAQEKANESESDSDESEEDNKTPDCDKPLEEEFLSSSKNKTFTYLFRSSKKERVFIPENHYKGVVQPKQENEFISLGDDNEDDIKIIDKIQQKNISGLVPLRKETLFKKKKEKEKRDSQISMKSNDCIDEDYEVPKKKPKVGWTIDKVGNKSNIKYSPANIVKFKSNENRKGKNKNNN